MAASVSCKTLNIFQKALHFLPNRQISIFHSEITHLHRSSVHIQKLCSNRLSSTSAAASDPSAEKVTNTEGEQSNQNVKNEVSPKEKELLEEKEKLLEDVKNLNDKYMRALADNENIRNRMRREINDAKQYGIQGFVKDLVEVADVLGKATESVPKEALESDNPHLKGLFQGLQMTEAQLLSVFKRHGVAKINPIGEKFNPNLHEALFEQVDASKEPGTVGTVTKVGYRLHDRVVRPAMVGVVKAAS
ncbi:GrpE 1, mitochondrial [Araneus ventricosus]|uniref:GrpE protein homolog n=1 Tax=Araneus ventricosus TaxID=182803 RepID=A0A4Y2E678_ARAVE|nr:GrpE 1, mitochondrial [Araneus ventricosus]